MCVTISHSSTANPKRVAPALSLSRLRQTWPAFMRHESETMPSKSWLKSFATYYTILSTILSPSRPLRVSYCSRYASLGPLSGQKKTHTQKKNVCQPTAHIHTHTHPTNYKRPSIRLSEKKTGIVKPLYNLLPYRPHIAASHDDPYIFIITHIHHHRDGARNLAHILCYTLVCISSTQKWLTVTRAHWQSASMESIFYHVLQLSNRVYNCIA